MFEPVIYAALILFGLVLGSFAGASVWRIRARQLRADKKQGEPVNAVELKRLKPLLDKKFSGDRSRCLHCGHVLRWYELIPVVSWLALRGKCRECRKPIGWFELLIELGTAVFFIVSYLLWPVDLTGVLPWIGFILWLVAGVLLAMLFAYDAKWSLLPDGLNYGLMGVGLVAVILTAVQSATPAYVLLNALGSVGILGGIYFVLHYASQGRWVGFGDVKLGVGLGLLLGDWQLAFASLFLANFIGCLVVIPALVTKRLKRNAQVPFGPFLILGMLVAKFAGTALLGLYLSSLV